MGTNLKMLITLFAAFAIATDKARADAELANAADEITTALTKVTSVHLRVSGKLPFGESRGWRSCIRELRF